MGINADVIALDLGRTVTNLIRNKKYMEMLAEYFMDTRKKLFEIMDECNIPTTPMNVFASTAILVSAVIGSDITAFIRTEKDLKITDATKRLIYRILVYAITNVLYALEDFTMFCVEETLKETEKGGKGEG